MFVGFFEIDVSVTVKHVQKIGIIRAFCLPGGTCWDFKCLGGQKRLLGYGLLGGDQYPGWHYVVSQSYICEPFASHFVFKCMSGKKMNLRSLGVCVYVTRMSENNTATYRLMSQIFHHLVRKL